MLPQTNNSLKRAISNLNTLADYLKNENNIYLPFIIMNGLMESISHYLYLLQDPTSFCITPLLVP